MKNNKGFSLVELIIVIAIMAILVGVIAPQLIKYIEKTNESSDTQLCDSIRSALTTAALDPDVVKDGHGPDLTATTISGVCADSTYAAAVADILGFSATDTACSAKLKSKVGKAAGIHVSIAGSNAITVYCNSSIKSGN